MDAQECSPGCKVYGKFQVYTLVYREEAFAASLVVVWCIGVSELVKMLGDEVETRNDDTTTDVSARNGTQNPKRETGAVVCWDPQLSYLGTVSCVVTRLVALLGGVCGCVWYLSKDNRLSRWNPSGAGEGPFRSELSATRKGCRL